MSEKKSNQNFIHRIPSSMAADVPLQSAKQHQSRFIRIFFNVFLFITFFMCIMLAYQNNFTARFMTPSSIPLRFKRRLLKRILLYTAFFGNKQWGFLSPVPEYVTTCNCKVYGDCDITIDKNLFDKSDLVIFHAHKHDMHMTNDLESLNKNRPKNQLWMHFSMENPYNTPDVTYLDQYFNLTSSYRKNADMQWLYSWVTKAKKLEKPSDVKLPNYAKAKTKLIAWAVSNCGRRRDLVAEKLNEHGVRIDNYGECDFAFTNNIRNVKDIPFNQYKFYFAAENDLCEDYVTEKYWVKSFVKNRDMVPVVFGGGNYSDPRVAIPGSFIDALSFESPKKLAEHLLLLDKNDTLYNEYFAWKKVWSRGEEINKAYPCNPFACELCEKLHANNWNFRKNPLINEINIEKECRPHEQYFEKWINR